MATCQKSERAAQELADAHIPLSQKIAARLHRWYSWVPMDDLYSYAYLGVALAARTYRDDLGVPFANFAARKAMYLAIDEMRKDGVLRRRRETPGPQVGQMTPDMPEPVGPDDHAKLEVRDLCRTLLSKLRDQDRQLLMMYYADHMTFKEVAKVFEISESAVCLRHKALLNKLRKMAASPAIA